MNFFGLVDTTKAFLPLLRQSRGRIVNMSRWGGWVGGSIEFDIGLLSFTMPNTTYESNTKPIHPFTTTNSMAGLLSLPAVTAYTCSKAAVEAFSDILRLELRKHGISVSVIGAWALNFCSGAARRHL